MLNYEDRYKGNGFHDRSKSEFFKVERLVDKHGTAVILKNSIPRYHVIDFSKAEQDAGASDEDIMSISKRLIAQNKEARARRNYLWELDLILGMEMHYGAFRPYGHDEVIGCLIVIHQRKRLKNKRDISRQIY